MSSGRIYNVILNNTNVISSSNSIFKYNFLNGSFNVTADSEICVSQLSLPYSWFNITSQYANNTLSINFPTPGAANTYTSYPLTLPSGFYTQTTLNQYLQQWSIQNGYFLVNTTTGQFVYFLQLAANATFYGDQLFTFVVPSSATLATLYPGTRVPIASDGGAAWPGFPLNPITPQFNITNASFGTIIGFLPGLYPPTAAALNVANYNVISNTFINTTPVNSVIIRCSLVSNPVSMPSDVLDLVPITGPFGSNIIYSPSFEKWVSLTGDDSKYNQLTITFTDQNFNLLQCQDNNIALSLLIKVKPKIKTINFSSN